MVTNIKDKNGKIVSYLEYSLTDKAGNENLEGDFVLVRDYWVHEKFRHRKTILWQLIKKMLPNILSARWVYWERQKYDGKAQIYPVKKFIRKAIEHEHKRLMETRT